MVETAGQHPDGIGDLPDRGTGDPLTGEQIRGFGQNQLATISWLGHRGITSAISLG
jgi:hypothetical protein